MLIEEAKLDLGRLTSLKGQLQDNKQLCFFRKFIVSDVVLSLRGFYKHEKALEAFSYSNTGHPFSWKLMH